MKSIKFIKSNDTDFHFANHLSSFFNIKFNTEFKAVLDKKLIRKIISSDYH